jgi:hypothetical protein
MIKGDLSKGKIDIDRVAEAVVVPDRPNINRYSRAEIIIGLARDTKCRILAEKFNTSVTTIEKIKKQNLELIERLQRDLASFNVEKESKIINKLLELLDKKVERLAYNEDALDIAKMTELSTTIKDLHNKLLLDQGKATNITEYKNKTENELIENLKEATLLLEQGDKKALLTAVFEKE